DGAARDLPAVAGVATRGALVALHRYGGRGWPRQGSRARLATRSPRGTRRCRSHAHYGTHSASRSSSGGPARQPAIHGLRLRHIPMAVTPYALKDAPALIERAFPAQKLSLEAYVEQMAGSGKTLTALGSYWKGRKPLVLARACVL